MRSIDKILAYVIALILAVPLPTPAQPDKPATPFNAEQLDQLAAPIALYPDPLLAQILMASTYPLEIVQAARFAKDNPSLGGDRLNEALKNQSWDDSVKSLVAFPQVLAMMDAKLDLDPEARRCVPGPAERADGCRPAPAGAGAGRG